MRNLKPRNFIFLKKKIIQIVSNYVEFLIQRNGWWQGGQKRTLAHLDPELHMVMSCHVASGS